MADATLSLPNSDISPTDPGSMQIGLERGYLNEVQRGALAGGLQRCSTQNWTSLRQWERIDPKVAIPRRTSRRYFRWPSHRADGSVSNY